MKKENKSEKKLSLKKLQITQLNMIRGGDGDIDTMTGGDKTASKYCNTNTINGGVTVSLNP